MKEIKILAITDDKNGSRFHRVTYPLSYIKNLEFEYKEEKYKFLIDLKEFNENTLEKAANYDIFFFHFDIDLKLSELAILQSKGVKIIYSNDDYMTPEEGHYLYGNDPVLSRYITNRVKGHLMNADAVIVSNDRLASHYMKYTTSIAVNNNFLNLDDFKVEKTESDKLRVGIIGSGSHLDNFKSLKGVINRINENKELSSKLEFYLCGYVKDTAWEEIAHMFSKKKNINWKTVEYKGLDNYIEFYKDLDVVLLPLLPTEFNACRSSLKLAECMCTNTLPVGSAYYSLKELQGLLVCEQPIHYEQTLEKLTDKEFYKGALEHISKFNREDNKFEERIQKLKEVFITVYNSDLKFKIDNIDLYGITYDKNQYTEFIPYDNSGLKEKPQRFEYTPIIDIIHNKELKDYTGVLSWKFVNKTGLSRNILSKMLHYHKYNEYDFINLSRKYWKTTNEFLDFSYQQHPKLEELLKKVVKNLGKEFKFYKNEYTWSNFFIMKSEFYKDYVDNWVIPSINYMENEIWEEINVDSGYEGIGKEKLKELTNLDFYNMQTFILERLINVYIYYKNLKVLNLF